MVRVPKRWGGDHSTRKGTFDADNCRPNVKSLRVTFDGPLLCKEQKLCRLQTSLSVMKLPKIQLIHTATPDTTKLSCLRRVRFGGMNWIPDNSKLSPTENLKSKHVQSNRPIHTGTPDTTHTGPSCRVGGRCKLGIIVL